MASIDVSQIPEVVKRAGYGVMIESYEAVPTLYPLFSEIVLPDEIESPLYGDKGSVIEDMERFKEREDGQEIEASSAETAYTWRIKCRQFSRKIVLPARLLRAANASARVPGMIAQFAGGFGRVAPLQKDDFCADIFQKGTLTAGSRPFFDNTYPGETDSNAGFIYDGLPFFDTAHTISGGSGTYANHVVSSALSQANLQTALTAMTKTNAVNERGERVLIQPTHLMVPPGLEYTAKVILQSAQATGGNNNDINPIAGTLQLMVNRALDDAASASSWWLVTSGQSLRVIDVEVIAEFEYGAGVKNWRYSYCANKAAS